MAKKLTLQEQANELIKQAEQGGIANNFFFVTTFKRYQVQMRMLSELERAINEYGPTVSKEYVKGRENIVVNPAFTEYNKTTTAANGTVQTLSNILKTFAPDEAGSKLDEFISALNGDG